VSRIKDLGTEVHPIGSKGKAPQGIWGESLPEAQALLFSYIPIYGKIKGPINS